MLSRMAESYRIGTWRELVAPTSFDFEIARETAALVCVDLQRKTVSRDARRGFANSLERLAPGAADRYFGEIESQVIPNVQLLQACFRELGVRVVHFMVGPAFSDGSDLPYAFRQTQRASMEEGGEGIVALGDPDFEIAEAVAPLEGEPVFHKVTMGGFTGTSAERVLRNLGVETLVLVGGHTHACVESTGRVAADLGFEVAVVEDAVVNYLPLMHDAAMINFSSFVGRVLSTAEVIEELRNVEGSGAAQP
jgi:nicotinamidase-related amidase